MTLLNTVANLSSNWPSMMAMYFVDMLTKRECHGTESGGVLDAVCLSANSEVSCLRYNAYHMECKQLKKRFDGLCVKKYLYETLDVT